MFMVKRGRKSFFFYLTNEMTYIFTCGKISDIKNGGKLNENKKNKENYS